MKFIASKRTVCGVLSSPAADCRKAKGVFFLSCVITVVPEQMECLFISFHALRHRKSVWNSNEEFISRKESYPSAPELHHSTLNHSTLENVECSVLSTFFPLYQRETQASKAP